MKAIKFYTEKKSKTSKAIQLSFHLLLILSIVVLFSSCEDDYYGRDGRSGDAYLSLTWANEMPEYMDAGTGDIPPTFKWGDYYRAYPGYYVMYYEGSVWNGFGWTFYAYEVEYEIWINEGEPGRPYGVDGRDGADTYLTLECSPYGPFIFTMEKSSGTSNKYEILKNTEEEIQVIQKGVSYSIKITYKKSLHSKAK